MMAFDIFVVDSFTDKQFKGNPAAVVLLEHWIESEKMQAIAAENNLSETAFIRSLSPNQYEIRWFSPLTEIDFCGHATLASSYVIFNYLNGRGEIEFRTSQVGSLFVREVDDGRIQMSFPNQCPDAVEEIPEALLKGLSYSPVQVLKNRQAYFAVMSSDKEVECITYQAEQLKRLAPYDVVVTAQSDTFDFVSRYFWPANGGDEDPVTGSIHSGLAPFWAEKLAKSNLVAYQASSRGGILYCSVRGERVMVSGFGVLYMKGTIYI